jgi:tetratricopeptide (TPR) repeat protein
MSRVTPQAISLPSRYRILGRIASGGMASVWEAHDELLDRPVAVKLLAEHLGRDDSSRQRFQREARAAAVLSSHRHVVTIYDVGEYEDRLFIVMELMRGGSVSSALREGRVPPARAADWLRQAASGLDAAHEAGIVHRDVKPANLLLDEHGRLAIADFGIARRAVEDSQLTATGQILGTAAYVSPEQAMGEQAVPASDRYALAVVAYELLTGRRPFAHEHYAAQARAHVEDAPAPASTAEPALPPEVDRVLERGLAKDPKARWATAGDFVDALDLALAGAAPPPRRRLAVAAATALAALLLAAGVAAVLIDNDGDGARERAQPQAQKRDRPRQESTPERRKEKPKATATATATPSATATATPTATATSAVSLNSKGYELFKAGNYGQAIPLFQRAVKACGDSTEMDPCGYTLYNLGAALRRSGEATAAIPILEDRMARFGDNGKGEVRKELDAAYADAGVKKGKSDKNGKRGKKDRDG